MHGVATEGYGLLVWARGKANSWRLVPCLGSSESALDPEESALTWVGGTVTLGACGGRWVMARWWFWRLTMSTL